MRILVASSNRQRTERVYSALRKAGCVVDSISPPLDVAHGAASKRYAVIVTDQQCAKVAFIKARSGKNVPLFIVLIEGGAAEGIKWLDAGADDFLLQPFHNAELSARVRALARRAGDLIEYDFAPANELYGVLPGDGGADLRQSRIPTGLQQFFGLLFSNRGRIVTYETISSHHLRGGRVISRNMIHVMALRLRRHITSRFLPISLSSVRNLGYRLDIKKSFKGYVSNGD